MEDKLVFILEDDVANQELIQLLLTDMLGVSTASATDGEEGLRRVRELKPDLVLLDLRLPKLDGFEVARRLKSDPTTRAIPLLVVSALSRPKDREEALAAGSADYIQKPFDLDDLADRVRRYLSGEARQEALFAVLQRVHADLAFRRRYEQDPEAALAGYAADLDEQEWQMLMEYPSTWLQHHSVQPCPRCGELAIAGTAGDLLECSNCRSGEAPPGGGRR